MITRQTIDAKEVVTAKRAKVLVYDVHDGDTVHIFLEGIWGSGVTKSIRLARINAPEIDSKDPVIKAAAVASRDFLASIVFAKWVYLDCDKLDDHSRAIGEFYLTKTSMKSVSDMVAESGNAVYVKY
jgi:endonuclease YncB( thermonuclease family)